MLNRRQLISYGHIVDIYKPLPARKLPNGTVLDPGFPDEPTYPKIQCALYTTPEVDDPAAAGRTKQYNIFVLDKFYFDITQDIDDGYLLRLLTPNHPDFGAYWVVQGNAKDKVNISRRRANYRYVYGKRGPGPSNIYHEKETHGMTSWFDASLLPNPLVNPVASAFGPTYTANAPFPTASLGFNGTALSALLFDGSGSLTSSLPISLSSFHIFVAGQFNTSLNSNILTMGSGSNLISVFNSAFGSSNILTIADSGQGFFSLLAPAIDSTEIFGPRVMSISYDGATGATSAYINGIRMQTTSTGPTGLTTAPITGNVTILPSAGSVIAEVVIASAVLGEGDRRGIELKLGNKWGIDTQ